MVKVFRGKFPVCHNNIYDAHIWLLSISVLQKQLEEEEKLSNQQAETLKSYQQKYEMINSVLSGDIAERLARHYGKHLNRY